MEKEQNQKQHHFVFYEYLLFFWKKKNLFLIIPLIFILGATLLSLFHKETYTGQAIVYVGGVTPDSAINPDLIQADYKKHLPAELKASFQVIVPKSGQISIQLTGENKDQVETSLNKIVNNYMASLTKVYDKRYESLSQYAKTLANRIEELQQSTSYYSEKVKANPAHTANSELLIENQKELATAQERLQIAETDLLFLEQERPREILPPTVSKQPSPFVSNLIVGFILGIFTSLFILIIMKYLHDAKLYDAKRVKEADAIE